MVSYLNNIGLLCINLWNLGVITAYSHISQGVYQSRPIRTVLHVFNKVLDEDILTDSISYYWLAGRVGDKLDYTVDLLHIFNQAALRIYATGCVWLLSSSGMYYFDNLISIPLGS